MKWSPPSLVSSSLCSSQLSQPNRSLHKECQLLEECGLRLVCRRNLQGDRTRRTRSPEMLQSSSLLPYILSFSSFLKLHALGNHQRSLDLPGSLSSLKSQQTGDAKSCSLRKKQRGWISSWKTKGRPGLQAGGACQVRVLTPWRRHQPPGDVTGHSYTSLTIYMAVPSPATVQ